MPPLSLPPPGVNPGEREVGAGGGVAADSVRGGLAEVSIQRGGKGKPVLALLGNQRRQCSF